MIWQCIPWRISRKELYLHSGFATMIKVVIYEMGKMNCRRCEREAVLCGIMYLMRM